MSLRTRLRQLERHAPRWDGSDITRDEFSQLDAEYNQLGRAAMLRCIDIMHAANLPLTLKDPVSANAFCWLIRNNPGCAEAWARFEARKEQLRRDPAFLARVAEHRRARKRR